MVRGFGLVLLCVAVLSADPLEDAARTLARKVNGRLQNGDLVRLTVRNLTALPDSEVVRVRGAIEKSLRRPARPGAPVDVAVTLSSSQSDHLLVAEIRRGDTRTVEMISFQPAPSSDVPSALPVIERKLIWTQEEPLLDLAIQGDRMLVLDARRLSLYRNQQGQWERVATAALPALPRDPRGRLEPSAQGFTVILPAHRCAAETQPELKLECTPGTVPSLWNGSGDPEATTVNACGGTMVLTSSNRDWDQPDVLTAFQMNGGKPKAATAPLEVPGPVTALWPTSDSALAIVKDLSTSRYAAYRLTIDCSR